jgi:hypothetical protein
VRWRWLRQDIRRTDAESSGKSDWYSAGGRRFKNPAPESHDTISNAAIGSAKAEGRVMLTAEQNGKIEFIERDSNV